MRCSNGVTCLTRLRNVTVVSNVCCISYSDLMCSCHNIGRTLMVRRCVRSRVRPLMSSASNLFLLVVRVRALRLSFVIRMTRSFATCLIDIWVMCGCVENEAVLSPFDLSRVRVLSGEFEWYVCTYGDML